MSLQDYFKDKEEITSHEIMEYSSKYFVFIIKTITNDTYIIDSKEFKDAEDFDFEYAWSGLTGKISRVKFNYDHIVSIEFFKNYKE